MTIENLSATVFCFTSRVAAMSVFLQQLGLRPRITSQRSNDDGPVYAVLAGRNGRVALHHTTDADQAGQRSLVVGTDDFDEALTALTEEGFTTTQWDEAFGRAGGITTDRGDLWIDDTGHADAYGYVLHSETAGPVDVQAVLFSAELDGDRELLHELGFLPPASPDDSGETWTAPHGGAVHLHPETDQVSAEQSWQVALGFETSAELDDLVEALHEAGHQDARRDEWALTVTDPDGHQVQVFPARG